MCSIKALAIGLFLSLVSTTGAFAQCGTTAPANKFCGNDTGSSALATWKTIPSGALTAIAGGTVLGNPTGALAVPIATPAPVLGIPGAALGSIGFGNLTSGTVTLRPVTGALGTSILSIPAITDTIAGFALANGGTNNSLTASNGGIVYSDATKLNVLSGTATSRQMLQSGASSVPAWSTATWPATTTINQILYSSAANTVVGLATANSSILVTSSGGVPSLSTTMPAITLGGTISGNGNNINNVIIGAVTPLTGTFTDVAASSIVLNGATSGGVGTISGTANQNTQTYWTVTNTSTGVSAIAGMNATNSASNASFGIGGVNFAAIPSLANKAFIFSNAGAGGINIYATGAVPIDFYVNAARAGGFTSAGVLTLAAALPVASGGSNCLVASGTCLDNITGFASTGFLTRTGAGTYAFQSTTGGITNANLANSSVTVNGTAISLGASGTVTAAAGTLTGATLASGVTASSLTSLGTITSLTATTINAFTLGGTISGGGNQLNNIIIGTATPLAGAFTTLTASTSVSSPSHTSSSGNANHGSASAFIFSSNGGTYAGSITAAQLWSFGTNTVSASANQLLTLTKNAATLPNFQSYTPMLQIAAADATQTSVVLQSFNTGAGLQPVILYGHARGTAASPTANVANDAIGSNFAHGYATSASPGYVGGAGFSFVVTEATCTTTACGTKTDIYGTPTGGVATAIKMSVGAGVSVGTTAALDQGTGTLNVQTASYLNNKVAWSATAPTVNSGFCTSPSISSANGTAAFTITIGTACAASTGVLTMPTANAGWSCYFANITTPASNVPSQTASTTTSVSVTNYARTTGLASNWTASEVITSHCTAY